MSVSSTSDSNVAFSGGARDTSKGMRWNAKLHLQYSGEDERPVVFKRMGVTVLGERVTTDKLLIDVPFPGKNRTVDFRVPTLLNAYTESNTGSLTLQWKGKELQGALLPVQLAKRSDLLPPLVVTPDEGAWPTQKFESYGNPTMNLPCFRTVEGRLPVVVALERKSSKLAKALNLQAKEVLGGLVFEPACTDGLPIELTAKGVEFCAHLPDPTADFGLGARADGTIEVIVRLEANEERAFLRLVGCKDRMALDALEGRLASAFATLRADGAPADIRFDVRPAIPDLRWPLVEKNGKFSIDAGREDDGSGYRFSRWTVWLDERTLNARIRSTHAGETAVASVVVTSVRMLRGETPPKLTLELNEPAQADAIQVSFTPKAGGDWETHSTFPPTTPVVIDLDEPAARLEAALVEMHALAHGEPLPAMFIPVQRGVLQLPVPQSLTLESDMSNDAGTAALQGKLVAAGPVARTGRKLTIESAMHCGVSIEWKGVARAFKVSEVVVSTREPTGRLEAYLFALEGSPTPEEVLPTLAAGEAATRDLPIEFGVQRISGRWWPGSFDHDRDKNQWHLRLPLPGGGHAWMRDARHGTVGIVPLTRSARASTKPSVSRGFLPVRLGAPEKAAPAELDIFFEKKDDVVGNARYGGPLSWVTEEELQDSVMPTLPGIQLRPRWPAEGGSGLVNGWTWDARLRYGLPALDEFFGNVELPRPKEGDSAPPPSGATALQMQDLKTTWLRAFDKMRLSWAQSQFAHEKWIAADGKASAAEVIGLVEPYSWATTLTIDMTLPQGVCDFKRPAPLGSYRVAGDTYAMALALPGFGKEGEALSFVIDGRELKPGGNSKTVVGMAAATIDADSLQLDSRSFAIASAPNRPHGPRGCLLREARFTDKKWATSDFALLTMPGMAEIDAELRGGGRLGFFARDLPVARAGEFYEFDGAKNPCENSPGENGKSFDADAFGSSLHEWRLFQIDENGSHRRYDILWGPLAFTPLRLWALKLEDGKDGPKVRAISVLGRLNLSTLQGSWGGAAGQAPFGPEEPYLEGNHFMLELAEGKLGLKPVQVNDHGDVIEVEQLAKGSATLRVSAKLARAGEEEKIAAVVKLDPTRDTATVHARLLGSERSLHGKVSEFSASKLSIVCTAADNPSPKPAAADEPPPAVRATEITLVVTREHGNWTSSIALGLAFDFVNSTGTSLFARNDQGRWTWLNLPEKQETFDALEVSHASGAVTLAIDGEFGHIQPLLGFDACAFRVSGILAHVFADDGGWPHSKDDGAFHFELTGQDSKGPLRLDHVFSGVGQSTDSHRFRIGHSFGGTSVIRWPTSVQVRPDDESVEDPPYWTPDHRKWSRLMDIGPASDANPLLEHTVNLRLSDHLLPANLLRRLDAGLGIGNAWRTLACVHHTLATTDGKKVSWSSLDRVCVEPAHAFFESTRGNETFHVYAARYMKGKYRDNRRLEKTMQHPGVGPRNAAQSGWSDPHLAAAFAGLEARWQPVVHGGSYTLFDTDPQAADPRAHAAVIPWLMGVGDGPLQKISLAQSGTEPLRWRVASVDVVAGDTPLRLGRQAGGIAMAANTSHADIEELVLPRPANQDDKQREVALQALRLQVPVTQAYFELFSKTTARSMDAFPQGQVPYFPQALLALRAMWRASRNETVQVWNLIASGAPDKTADAQRVRVIPAATRAALSPPVLPIELVVLGARSIRRIGDVAAVAAGAKPLDAFADGRSRARLRELVLQRAPDAAVVLAHAPFTVLRDAWGVLDMPARLDDYGLQQHDLALPEPLPASPALGWPSSDQTERLAKLAPVVGHDVPLVSSSSGLAARASVLRFPAWAPAANEQEAIYLSLASHVVFDRGPSEPGEQVVFRGPPARHLSVAPVRLRAPLRQATEELLARLAPPVSPEAKGRAMVAPVTPPHVERASMGHRPGEFHAWITRMVLPAESSGFDPEHASYGRPASSAPVIARQLRTPRAPLFPDDQDAELRRRTFVSSVDKIDDRLRQMLVFAGHATVARFRDDKGIEHRYAIQPLGKSSDSPFRLDGTWDGELRLAISGAADIDKDRLASFGLVPHENAKTNGALRLGRMLLPFEEWEMTGAPTKNSVVVSLFMKSEHARTIAAELGRTSVDVPLALDLQVAGSELVHAPKRVLLGLRTGAGLREGPPINLTLPLLRSAGNRATLSVDVRTLVFGDPAYDRQLGSPAFRSEPVEVVAANVQSKKDEAVKPDITAKLALVIDREEYNLDDSVHFSAALIADKDYLPKHELRISVELQPKRGEDGVLPKARKLLVPGEHNAFVESCPIDARRAYALHPRSLVEESSKPVQLNPGDQLRLMLSAESNKKCILTARLTDLPSIAPPPAVYSLVTIDDDFTGAEVALHACAPLPDRLEYPSLEADLANGYVHRRALFIWPWGSLQQEGGRANLVKVDRSGGAQLPAIRGDFLMMPNTRESQVAQLD